MLIYSRTYKYSQVVSVVILCGDVMENSVLFAGFFFYLLMGHRSIFQKA